jgi:hypothetical protein
LTGITGCSAVRWAFTSPGGTPFYMSGGTFGGGATMQRIILIMKIDSDFHKNGIVDSRSVVNTAQNFRDQRTKFHTSRNIQMASFSQEDKIKMLQRINDLRNVGNIDEEMLSVVIDALELPVQKGSTSTTMVSPAVAAVVLWAVKTFGPVLAAKALRYLKEKLMQKK